MATVLKGIIRGKTIELEAEPGLPDGQEVSVTVAPTAPPSLAYLSEENRRRFEEALAEVKDLAPGEGLRRAAGAWAEDAEEVDRFIEWTYEQRKLDRPPLEL
jgi:hypothetical protein